MNDSQKTIIELVKQSQFGTEAVLSNDIDWTEVYEEATLQSVQGIVAPVLPTDANNHEQWMSIQYKQTALYVRYCYAEEELYKLLNKENIPFVILKGNSAAVNYQEPSLRAMGDIDLIVKPDVFERTKQVLIDNGYELHLEHDEDQRHIGFSYNGTEFELHRYFSHDEVSIEDYVLSGIDNAVVGRVGDHSFPMLPKLANGLVLLLHMRQHLKAALGLRQVIDWMMYVYRELDDEFWNNEFGTIAREKGLDTLAIVATRMCQIYMGLPETITWCKGADEKLCGQLMENLLESGNFGRKHGRGTSVETVSTSIKRKGLFRWLQYAGEYNWVAYREHHWLKPFCWLYQIFRYAKQGFKSGRDRKQLGDDLDRSKQRYEMLKKLGI